MSAMNFGDKMIDLGCGLFAFAIGLGALGVCAWVIARLFGVV